MMQDVYIFIMIHLLHLLYCLRCFALADHTSVADQALGVLCTTLLQNLG